MRLHRGRLAPGEERGAVAIIVAVSMTMLLVAVAMVLDFGIVRLDRQVNKAAVDSSTSAGIQGLDRGNGNTYSYAGVCEALRYLKANKPADLGGLNWSACSDLALLAKICDPADTTTWAKYDATTGPYRVTIQNPYVPASTGFPEETLSSLSADQGDAAAGGCDQLAVIIAQTRKPGLGSLATSSDITTVVRSVGRITRDDDPQVPVAMLILEKTDCKALNVSGTNTQVFVDGFGPYPGVIHSDSDGTTSCSGSKVLDTSVLNGIVAGGATQSPLDENGVPTTDPPQHGLIGSVALEAGVAANAASGLDYVHGLPNPPKYGPEPRPAVGRIPLDDAYRIGVQNAITTARTAWSSGASYILPAGQTMTSLGSGPSSPCPTPSSTVLNDATALFLNCSPSWNPGVEFKKARTVIIKGTVSKGLSLPVADRVYLYGNWGSGRAAISLTGSDSFRMHQGMPTTGPSPTTCSDNTELERARLIIGGGGISQSGGLLQMCHTSVIMMGGHTTGCVPPKDGESPYNSPCPGAGTYTSPGNGVLDAQGGTQEWTAPNRLGAPPDPAATVADREDLEDLALWTETAGTGHKLTGGGFMHLSGVFMLPNAKPFNLSGGSTQDASNAQYVVRTLDVTGGAQIYMRPKAYDAPKLPEFTFELVR